MNNPIYMPNVTITYHQPNGPTQQLTSDQDGYLTGAVCPVCHKETIYLTLSWRAVSVPGCRPKAIAEQGIRPACKSDECNPSGQGCGPVCKDSRGSGT